MAKEASRDAGPLAGQEPDGAEGAIPDLPRPEVAPKQEDAVRGGAALAPEKKRQIANDTVR